MMFLTEIIQIITNKCDIKTKLNIQTTCKYLYDNIKIYTFYETLKCDSFKICKCPNISVTSDTLKRHKYITELDIMDNDDIIDDDIKHLTSLKVLYVNKNITNKGLKEINLNIINIFDNNNVDVDGFKHMDLKTIYANVYANRIQSLKANIIYKMYCFNLYPACYPPSGTVNLYNLS